MQKRPTWAAFLLWYWQVTAADSTGGCNTSSAYAVSSVLHPPVESACESLRWRDGTAHGSVLVQEIEEFVSMRHHAGRLGLNG